MFGGLCFLLQGNLLVGVWKDSLGCRPPHDGEAALREPHVRVFDITEKADAELGAGRAETHQGATTS